MWFCALDDENGGLKILYYRELYNTDYRGVEQYEPSQNMFYTQSPPSDMQIFKEILQATHQVCLQIFQALGDNRREVTIANAIELKDSG